QALAAALPPERKLVVREAPVLGPAKPFIEMVLTADLEAPRKQRHTAHRIWQRIGEELGIEVAESTVRKYVGRRKREIFGPAEVMVPQVKEPGAEAEVDFFEATVWMAGREVVVICFQMRACYSGRVFVRALARLTQQAFLESMVLGLEYFGGVFGEIRMDNHSNAVERVMRGRTRVEHDRFVALRSHYLFESRFCRVGLVGAHEKGGVENGQGHFRRNHMVPLPECRDLAELNRQLLEACAREDERVPVGRQESKLEAWLLEQPELRPLPEERFSTVEYVDQVRVDDKSRARVKQVCYSVPARFAGRLVRAEVSSDQVLLFGGGEQVARWERCWEPNGERLDLDHYLEVLRHKPQAFWRSLPMRQAQQTGRWPPPYTEMFLKLKERLGESAAARQMVDVLLLHRRYPAEVVDQAVAGALTAGALDGRAVALLVRRAQEGQRHLTVLEVGGLDIYQRPQPQVDLYDQLLQGGHS
ncbi:MAG TPA: IS21 family transposase, partial [Candidatus Dormibacteraeota bacterium]|nr:IS21 family transposase [Candidatus Dormibacteraeota bacterium]